VLGGKFVSGWFKRGKKKRGKGPLEGVWTSLSVGGVGV